jgi:hypothetical protein
MLLYLHDPDILHQREVDSVFKMPTKKQIETLAKKLMSRLFPNDDEKGFQMKQLMICVFSKAILIQNICPNCE